jgi:hypothetical protein
MVVETKFNDGEQVWFYADGKFFYGKIQYAECWTQYDGWNYVIEYRDIDGEMQTWSANENDIYLTKQEVMERAFVSDDTKRIDEEMLGDVDPSKETAAEKPTRKRK